MTTDVIIFHDEADRVLGGAFRAHFLWFVPTVIQQTTTTPLFGESRVQYSPVSLLYSKMTNIRRTYDLQMSKLHFTDISGQKWNKYDFGTRMLIDHSVDAMRSKRPEQYSHPLCCKLAVLVYPRKADKSIYGHPDLQERELRRNEVILRILLKGACHYLYSPSNHVRISRIVTDGQPHQRPLSGSRIIHQLLIEENSGRTPLREYVSFFDDADIVHLPSHHKLHVEGSKNHVYANMLQLTDLLGGAGLRSMSTDCDVWRIPPKIGDKGVPKKNAMAYSVRAMLMKSKRGKNFVRSGHYRSFTVNSLSFADGEMLFSQMRPVSTTNTQESLFSGQGSR